eukprot:Gregarina_sp_Poly_1__1693@NODE_1435_length_4151_cov_621_887120_g939_i1_p3_GENE_NODE_1435_length_4151_cov_621_887120_g939_i1NODE_1435_length_4151_cov_621_887120_g939_i1_p3_ORF_typecomplete_len144_score21_33LSM/PF01423_22/1e11_NODE_1435_length_4151_cov_621_887120_g939_i136714102
MGGALAVFSLAKKNNQRLGFLEGFKMATMSNRKLQKIMTIPVNQVFRFFTAREPVEIWLVDRPQSRILGVIQGFDEYMNIVLADAEEINILKNETDVAKMFGKRVRLGTILLKGENITLMALAPKELVSPPPSEPAAAEPVAA